jgi:C4-dicarboxylate-specific signal transduction histidine kinase
MTMNGMNACNSSFDAMKDVDTTRELIISSQTARNEQVIVSVSDTWVGLPPQQAEQMFNAFLPLSRNTVTARHIA